MHLHGLPSRFASILDQALYHILNVVLRIVNIIRIYGIHIKEEKFIRCDFFHCPRHAHFLGYNPRSWKSMRGSSC